MADSDPSDARGPAPDTRIPASDARNPDWPTCDDAQVEVMLLGTYHMDNPGLDEVNVDADDVLAPDRQAELRDLVSSLADWNPDRVAVERPADRADEVNDLYRAYRSGDRDYDRAYDAEAISRCRSEVVQVGFRLADRLGHESVATVDERPADPDPDPFADRAVDSTRKTTVDLPDPERIEDEVDRRLATSTIPEYYAWCNAADQLRTNHNLMFDAGIRATGGDLGRPTALAVWYDRNVRMVHHLWRTMAPTDERILFLVGSGHVRALGHLLTEAPMFCPVSPLPYLPDP